MVSVDGAEKSATKDAGDSEHVDHQCLKKITGGHAKEDNVPMKVAYLPMSSHPSRVQTYAQGMKRWNKRWSELCLKVYYFHLHLLKDFTDLKSPCLS